MGKLTISMVTANRPKEFEQALQSIQSLRFQDFKVIIADDSSDDASEKITRRVLPKAAYFRNAPPLREILNSNKCIAMADTEWVCLFHDDDAFAEGYFDRIITMMRQDPEIDLAYTGRIMVDQDDKELARQLLKSGPEYVVYSADNILEYMLLGKKLPDYRVFINTPGLVFKKKIFEQFGGFDASIDTHCDTDFLLKALSLSKKVLFVNEPLYINKLWYGVSGRTKTSERGEVFFAQKGVLDNFLSFCEKIGNKKYPSLRRNIYIKFARDGAALNGPMSWIAARYKGGYSGKVRSIWRTACAIVDIYPKILLSPKFYFVFLGSVLIPGFLKDKLLGVFLKFYNEKT